MPEYITIFKDPKKDRYFIKANTFDRRFTANSTILKEIIGEHHYLQHITKNENRLIVLTSEEFIFTKMLVNYIYKAKEGDKYVFVQ